MRQFKTGWKNIRRSPYQSMAAVMIMFLTLVAIGIFGFLSYSSYVVLDHFESKPELTVFFEDVKDRDEVRSLENKLEKTGKVAKIKYVSKEDALAIYKELFKDDPVLLEMVTASILPASLEISATEARYLEDINEILKKEEGVEEIAYQKDIVDNLIKVTTAIRVVGLALISYLTLTSLLVIVTIIGMKISSRRGEIEIMKLIGAKSWYIRAPFIWEGVIYGVFGALLATGACLGLIFWGVGEMVPFFKGIPLLPLPNEFYILLVGGEILLGAVIGAFGSGLVVWRYLKR